jgi:hypothetical protein
MPIHYQYRTEIPQTPVNNQGLPEACPLRHSFVIRIEFPSAKWLTCALNWTPARPLTRCFSDRRRFHLDTGGIISVL